MTIDLEALESLAKAATPGPWNIVRDPDGYTHYIGPSLVTQVRDDAAYIAAVSPDVVFELVAEVRRHRKSMMRLARALQIKNRALAIAQREFKSAQDRAAQKEVQE